MARAPDDPRVASILNRKGHGSLFDQLIPLSPQALERLSIDHPNVPADFREFLEWIGSGMVGDDAYIIYDGLVPDADIFGPPTEIGSARLCAGDDMAGYVLAFDANTWNLTELGPDGTPVTTDALDFVDFISKQVERLAKD